MTIGIPTETFRGERRVALVPASVPVLSKAGVKILVQAGAGAAAGFPDQEYVAKGAEIAPTREDVFRQADVILQVHTPSGNPDGSAADIALVKRDQVLIGFGDPLSPSPAAGELAQKGATTLAVELVPRITRAQSMDALSSMATIAGYKAVLIAAEALPRIFPMLMTAAGTIAPARVFVIGAGVAGLQAISTARRLGAKLEAYDVRPAVKEQIESLGAKFVELPLETAGSEDKGGYAVAQDERFYQRQRELLTKVVASSDVVITTAAIPGRKSPVLVTADMVRGMAPGSVIVDIAAERGGNCELTRADDIVVEHGVTIMGPTNLASTVPHHASQMYSKNLTTLLQHLLKDGKLSLDLSDEITREVVVTHGGEVVHTRVREVLGLPPAVTA